MQVLFVVLLVVLGVVGFSPQAFAMHIAEGFLPPAWCGLYFVLSAPFVLLGLLQIRKTQDPHTRMFFALAGAYVFLLSALKLPSVTGSCSHPTGTGLASILFGPAPTAFLSSLVLLFQALLLAHGGITTLGANILSMGVAGPLVGFLTYRALRNVNRNVAIFTAAFSADLSTYVVTSLQLALAFPGTSLGFSFLKFLSLFALTQVPLAVMEGFLTLALLEYLTAKLGVRTV
ncbi:MAG: energy-coupling factor ABC transporter permease [Atribacterota bacterium]